MEIENNTAVITCIDDNYEENLEKDFLESLRNTALYKGEVVVIDYGMSNERKEFIKENYNVKVFSFKKSMPVFAQRNRDIPVIIDILPNNISNIMLIDGGDVWFQKPIIPIFEKTKVNIGCVEEKIFFGQHEWIMECVDNLKGKFSNDISVITNGKPVLNAGMVCGPRENIKNIIKSIHYDTLSTGIEFFGIDQIFFNYELYKMNSIKIIKLDHEYNYVVKTHEDEFIIKEDKIYDKNMKLVTVVHNAGGLYRLIPKPYGNLISDELQYISKNVRPIKES